MTHHTRRGIVGLVGIIYLCLSVLLLLTSRGLAGQHADTTVPDLIAALKDPNPVVRRGGAITLGGLRAQAAAAVPALIEALQDPNPPVREAAAYALGSIGAQAQAAIPALIAAIKDPEPDVRVSAAEALVRLHRMLAAPTGPFIRETNPSPSAVPAFIVALKDTNFSVRRTAASSLGSIGARAQAAIPALIAALQDSDHDIAHVVANALAGIAPTLQDARATDMIRPLKAARDALADWGFDSQAQSVRRVVESLELIWWGNLTKRLWPWIHEHPYPSAVIAVYLGLALCWMIFYGIRPLWLYRINEALKRNTDFALPACLGGIKVPLRLRSPCGVFPLYRPGAQCLGYPTSHDG